jgi:N-methylhydantoinase B
VRRPLAVTLLLDGTKHPPGQGLHGGGNGRANSAVLRYPDGTRTPAAKVAGLSLPEGTVIEVKTGGGGGYGRPEERDPELVNDDLSQGHLTAEAARDSYPQAG